MQHPVQHSCIICVHLCNVARDSAENIEGRHTLLAAARRQGQVTLHEGSCTYTLEQRFFHLSVAAPRIQIYSNILNLWDTSLNFSVHTGRISLHSRRRILEQRVKFPTRARAREKKRRGDLLFPLRVSHALYNS